MNQKQRTPQQIAMHVSVVSIIWNVILSLFKFLAGIFAHSGAMLSDAVHSASDVFSTFVVMIGVRMAGRSSDEDHPYGHERMECVAAIILAVVLFAAGIGIGYDGVQKILSGSSGTLAVPGILALVAAIVSIVMKEAMFWYTRAAAKRIRSGALMADAWHHRSDALSSVGSFIGILGARMGLPILDPVASVVICLLILKAAYDIFMDAVGKMTDKACDEETQEKLKDLIRQQDGVLSIDRMRTRLFGDKIYVDVEIGADGRESLYTTHAIAQRAHDAIEDAFPDVKHCMIHVNPKNVQ